MVPSYVANMPSLVIWVNLGRIAVIGVLIVGYIQSYKAIKNKYKYEIDGIVEEFHKRGVDVNTSAAWMFLLYMDYYICDYRYFYEKDS